jgi:hypothetical protein
MIDNINKASFITNPISPILHHQSFITNPSSPILYHQSFITNPLSPILHHQSFITNPLPPILYHQSFPGKQTTELISHKMVITLPISNTIHNIKPIRPPRMNTSLKFVQVYLFSKCTNKIEVLFVIITNTKFHG